MIPCLEVVLYQSPESRMKKRFTKESYLCVHLSHVCTSQSSSTLPFRVIKTNKKKETDYILYISVLLLLLPLPLLLLLLCIQHLITGNIFEAKRNCIQTFFKISLKWQTKYLNCFANLKKTNLRIISEIFSL